MVACQPLWGYSGDAHGARGKEVDAVDVAARRKVFARRLPEDELFTALRRKTDPREVATRNDVLSAGGNVDRGQALLANLGPKQHSDRGRVRGPGEDERVLPAARQLLGRTARSRRQHQF